MSDVLLEVEGLTKRFGPVCAVDDVSFTVSRGEVVGLLGPNGAGKSTTIHMLIGLTRYDQGAIRYFGLELRRNKRRCLQRINFSSAYNSLQGRITVAQNLRVFAGLYSISDPEKKIDELAEYFEVGDLLNRGFVTLSAGQKTRVNLIKSLLNDPEILLLDEPTASLDPDIADKTLSLIEQMRDRRGIALIYTSHNMSEITRICDSVIFLDHGRMVAHDTPARLTKRIAGAELRLVVADGVTAPLLAWLAEHGHQASQSGGHGVIISLDEQSIGNALSRIGRAGFDLVDIEIRRPTLEDVFLQIARS